MNTVTTLVHKNGITNSSSAQSEIFRDTYISTKVQVFFHMKRPVTIIADHVSHATGMVLLAVD